MYKFIVLLGVLLGLGINETQAQAKDTLILMNGRVVVEKVVDTLLGAVTVMNPKKIGKKVHYEYDELYCVHYSTNFKDYYYSQDTAQGNWFTRDEMLMFIRGERDGRKGFKANGSLIGAGIFGLIGGASGSFFAPILPYGYMALSGIPKVRIRHSTISNPYYIDSDAYILGYERSARYKRKLRSLLGGSIGLALGYAIYFTMKDYYPETLSTGKYGFK
jgi:hypothetical protein